RARPAGEHLARGERGNAARGDEALSGDQGPGEGPGGRGARAPAAPGAHLPRAGRRVPGHGRPAGRLRHPDDAGARLWRRTLVRRSLGRPSAEAVHSLVIAVAPPSAEDGRRSGAEGEEEERNDGARRLDSLIDWDRAGVDVIEEAELVAEHGRSRRRENGAEEREDPDRPPLASSVVAGHAPGDLAAREARKQGDHHGEDRRTGCDLAAPSADPAA